MMTEQVKDRGGHSLTLNKINGRYFPPFPEYVMKEMTLLPLRHDDILLTGYIKAGTHWIWEVIRMLLKGSVDVSNMEKDAAMMELVDRKEIDALPSRRVLNTHVHFDQLPVDVLTKKPKIVYLTRNPKDTAVSLYNHHVKLHSYYQYDGNFKDHLQLFIEGKVDYGSWFSHIQSWSEAERLCRNDYNIDFMELNYEDMTENPQSVTSTLADFLGIETSDMTISAITDYCHISNMRQRKAKFDLDSDGKPIMYRKGMVGDWKNWFSVAQNEYFDEIYSQKMAAIDTPFHWRFVM